MVRGSQMNGFIRNDYVLQTKKIRHSILHFGAICKVLITYFLILQLLSAQIVEVKDIFSQGNYQHYVNYFSKSSLSSGP